jgi:predicted PurR-regulated permease PerM
MLVVTFLVLKPFLAPLFLASVCAVILQPLYKKILLITNKREALSSFITVFISATIALIPSMFLGAQVARESVQLYTSLSLLDGKENTILLLIQHAGDFFENLIPGTGSFFTSFSNNLDEYVKQCLMWFIDHLGAGLSGISFLLVYILVFLISLYYFLVDGPRLLNWILTLSPLDKKDDALIVRNLKDAVHSVIEGSLFVAFLHGILMTVVGFTIFGVPNSILWGSITIITALIPGIGASIVQVPGIIYLFVTGHNMAALGLTLWGAMVAMFIDNFLRPKLIGRKLAIPPLLILLSVLGGILFFGPIGVFLGPLTMSLLFAFLTVYSSLTISHKE